MSGRRIGILEESSDRPLLRQVRNPSISTDDDTSFQLPAPKRPEVPPLKLTVSTSPLPIQPKPLGLNLKLKLSVSSDAPVDAGTRIDLVASRKKQRDKMEVTSLEISRVTNFLYLSGIEPSKNRTLLDELKITTVMNLCGDLQPIPVFPDLKTFIYKVKDSTTEQLVDIFYECFEIIDAARAANQNILVHCHQGVSRSPTVVIAYLMMCNNLTFQAAFAHVRYCRNVVSPNAGFVFQVLNWWRWRHGNFIRCVMAEEVSHHHGLQGIVDLEEAAGADIAIKDALESRLMACQSNQDDLRLRPSYFYLHHGEAYFKRVDNFSPVSHNQVLVVGGLPVGLVAFYGASVQGSKEIVDSTFKFCAHLWEFEGEPRLLQNYKYDAFLQKLDSDPMLHYALIKMGLIHAPVDQGAELEHMKQLVLQKTKEEYSCNCIVSDPRGQLSAIGVFAPHLK